MVEGAPHTAKRSMINCCAYGVPLAMYIKEWRRGERAGPYGAPWRSPTPTGSRISPLPCSRSRREGKGKEKRRKEGAPPFPLVQFGLGLVGARNLPSLFPLKTNKAHVLLGEFP